MSLLALGLRICEYLLNQLVDFYEIWYGDDTIRRDLEAMFLIP
jgi:hypothetical protein